MSNGNWKGSGRKALSLPASFPLLPGVTSPVHLQLATASTVPVRRNSSSTRLLTTIATMYLASLGINSRLAGSCPTGPQEQAFSSPLTQHAQARSASSQLHQSPRPKVNWPSLTCHTHPIHHPLCRCRLIVLILKSGTCHTTHAQPASQVLCSALARPLSHHHHLSHPTARPGGQ